MHGEPQVIKAAVRGERRSGVKILAVTVMTSLTGEDLAEMGYGLGVEALVARRIGQAIDLGADGRRRKPARGGSGPPDGRPRLSGGDTRRAPRLGRPRRSGQGHDPRAALAAGASHLVCGRPITAAADSRAAALAIVAEMAGGA